jgi:4-hydroxythreonine-4-phosphate dehydrogenase
VSPAPVVITSGEPAGIGPDLCAFLGRRAFSTDLVVLGDRDLLHERARTLGVDWPAHIRIEHRALAAPCSPGKLDPANAAYVLSLLDEAIAGCMADRYAAMATAPVQKSVINDAGMPFSGHTEYLAAQAHAEAVMMLVGGGMRVALATTHLALRDVPTHLTPETLRRTIRTLEQDLRTRFGIAKPRILVAGLNPHAGESGYLGRDELELIVPVLDELRAQGLDLRGPYPADTLFTPQLLAQGDCVLAMYHDQGLPTLKYASFGAGVNVTLGLPFIRTSVDHGTALDLAGTGKADPGSLFEAVDLAIVMAGHARPA